LTHRGADALARCEDDIQDQDFSCRKILRNPDALTVLVDQGHVGHGQTSCDHFRPLRFHRFRRVSRGLLATIRLLLLRGDAPCLRVLAFRCRALTASVAETDDQSENEQNHDTRQQQVHGIVQDSFTAFDQNVTKQSDHEDLDLAELVQSIIAFANVWRFQQQNHNES